jgi:mRNA interferase MazF
MRARRGEVWLVDLGYVAKIRPCLVLSGKPLDTDRALVSLIPHTTSPRGTRFEVNLATSFLKPGAFDTQNLVTVSQAKLIRNLGVLSPDELAEIAYAVRTWLGL